MIRRDNHLNHLIRKQNNGLVKVIIGIRRCGKSYLLFHIFHDYLLSTDVEENHIISIALDDASHQQYWNPNELDKHIRSRIIPDGKTNYIFIDEIQFVKEVANPYLEGSKVGFTSVVLGLMKIDDVDVYIIGSNSEMLSKNIQTSFRGKCDQINVRPLSYKEFYDAYPGDKTRAWDEYLTYGGMPFILSIENYTDKSEYLKNLFLEIYIEDILENQDIRKDESVINDLLNIISSSIGSLTNPLKLSNTFKTLKKVMINPHTIESYLDYFTDSFLIDRAKRYDIKGKSYIESPLKYYFSDLGLRNARLNFREMEKTHIMENVIYNELRYRGFSVDVGVVEFNYKDSEGKSKRKQLEIDFVCNQGNDRIYIQSAYALPTAEKIEQETRGLIRTKDSFRKIVVVKDSIVPRKDENGIQFVGVEEFLLNDRYTANN